MPKVAPAEDFFVVGGPVQPDRACYVERAADAELARGIAEQRFCSVLAARSTGKSSLMARAIRRLRREGQLAAVVDLSQLGVRGESGDAARWYYGIAYRVLRELRLKIDLQGWWQEKSALSGEHRLAEFFSEIVLTHTSVPVTIFIDEIERTLSLPLAQDLFATIHTCYARRATEPDYTRLNFVVLGVASASELCPDSDISPFFDGLAVEPLDFTLEQSFQLAAGFGPEADDGRELIERIHAWSGGQPYVTQRIARGVARKSGKLEDVDRVVREQFLAPGAVEKDPYLNRIRLQLVRRGGRQRRALALLGKLARGVPVSDERSPAREWLRLAGVTAPAPDGTLRYRNRILREVFDDRWISAVRPFNWRSAAAIAAVVAIAVAVPIWYAQILPRPYIRTLSVVTQDFAVAEEAYEKLHRLPGFAATADRLLAEAMARRSREATTYAEVRAADHVLRQLPRQTRLADQLEADYWLRRAAAATHGERRDEALLLAVRAAETQGEAARRVAAELIGADYPRLRGTYRFGGTPAAWSVDWEHQALAVVDTARRSRRVPIEAAHDDVASGAVRLSSLQHVPVQREIAVDDERGAAGTFRLRLAIEHERPEDLLLVLTAPGGEEARAALDTAQTAGGVYELRADPTSRLGELASASRNGVWRVALVDRRAGSPGTLREWGLAFPGSSRFWRDGPRQGLAIPNPIRTEDVEAIVSPDGRFAAVYPSRETTVGAPAIWDLAEGRLLQDLEPIRRPDDIAFNADASRLIVQTGRVLRVWDVQSGQLILRTQAGSALAFAPAVSVGGDYVLIGESTSTGLPLLKLVRLSDGTVTAQSAGVRGAHAWALGPEARYAAAVQPAARFVTLLDPRRGSTIAVLRHERSVVRMIPTPVGDMLLTVDDLGDLRAWPVPRDSSRRGGTESYRIGTTVNSGSVSVSADGQRVVFEEQPGQLIVRDVAGELEPVHLRLAASGGVINTQLAPDGTMLVTASAGRFRIWDVDSASLAERPDPNLSALAIDAGGSVVGLGFRGGHVRVRSASELSLPAQRNDVIDYIGHRGRVTALDVLASRALLASGGVNGVVRIWDLASVAPTEHFMRQPAGPVQAVQLSPDGRWVASAADYFARLWRSADAELADEITVNGTALAVAFSPDSTTWAVGDSSGNVFLSTPGEGLLGSVRAQGPVRAIAFEPGGRFFASGDDTGHLELWDAVRFSPIGPRHRFDQAVRWIGFGGSASDVLIQTDAWIHRAAVTEGRIRVFASRLLPFGVAPGAAFRTAADARETEKAHVTLVGGLGAGPLTLHDIRFDLPSAAPLPEGSPLLNRDWSAALALEIGPDGEVTEVVH